MSEPKPAGGAPEHAERLASNVQPGQWQNPKPAGPYNLAILGGGTAGWLAAVGAAKLGAKVALVEQQILGGHHLHVGGIPSHGLYQAARAAALARRAETWGVHLAAALDIDFSKVAERGRRIQAQGSWNKSAAYCQSLGIDLFLGTARFLDAHSLEAAGQVLVFEKAAIATGAHPVAPNIPGLDKAGYLTWGQILSLHRLPRRMAVIGGRGLACEYAQTLQRLGAHVTLFHSGNRLLDDTDPEAGAWLQKVFTQEGMQARIGTRISEVAQPGREKILRCEVQGREETVAVDEILAAGAYAPRVQDLGLKAAGVKFSAWAGVQVNAYLQTTQPNIYAAGAVCQPEADVQTAEAHARLVLRNALFPGRQSRQHLLIPRCILTDPEIAEIHWEHAAGKTSKTGTETYRLSLAEAFQTLPDGEDEGFFKVQVAAGTDKIVGALMVSSQAGELINLISLAMANGLGLKMLGALTFPAFTQAGVLRQLAGLYQGKRIRPGVKKILSRWMAWQR